MKYVRNAVVVIAMLAGLAACAGAPDQPTTNITVVPSSSATSQQVVPQQNVAPTAYVAPAETATVYPPPRFGEPTPYPVR